MKKPRLLTALMIILLCLALCTFAGAEIVSGNTDSKDITWSMNTDTGILRIDGTGPMKLAAYVKTPWDAYLTQITDVVIGEGVTDISSSAFSGCTALKRVTLPETLTAVKSSAFSGCTSLKAISLPDAVTTIGGGAFSGCTSLEEIVLPADLTTISSSAFAYCAGLREVILPDGLQSIG